MTRWTKWALAAVALVSGPVGMGCQASQSSRLAKVGCDKCPTVDVRTPYNVPSYEGSRQAGYFSEKGMHCPGCKRAAVAHAQTGTLAPTCDTCGGNIRLAEAK